VTERRHELYQLAGHLPLRVSVAKRAAGRRLGRAIPAQIRGNDAMSTSQLGGDLPPADMGLRKAVQQEHGRAGATPGDEVARLPYSTPPVLEPLERHTPMMNRTQAG
jgi:hypothetical protein